MKIPCVIGQLTGIPKPGVIRRDKIPRGVLFSLRRAGDFLSRTKGETNSLFGVSISDAGTFPAREYGAGMIGTLFLTWYARNAGESQARRAIILDLFIYNAIGVAITVVGMLSGWFNLLGWGILAIYLFFAVSYGYYWFTRPVPAAQPGPA